MSEKERRQLEKAAAADRRAEELREKEKKRVANKKKREEKAIKEREARLANGIGDATQAVGYSHTQRAMKNFMTTWVKNAPPKPATEDKGSLANPYVSSPPQQPDGVADDDRGGVDQDNDDNDELQPRATSESAKPDQKDQSINLFDIGGLDDTRAAEDDRSASGCDSATDFERVEADDGANAYEIRPFVDSSAHQSLGPDGADGLNHVFDGDIFDQAVEDARPPSGFNSADDDDLSSPVISAAVETAVPIDQPNDPYDADDLVETGDDEIFDQAIEEIRLASDYDSADDTCPWEADSVEDELLHEALNKAFNSANPKELCLVSQGPSLPATPSQHSDGLPYLDNTLHTVLDEPASPVRPSPRISDSFMSSEWDISPEDMDAMETKAKEACLSRSSAMSTPCNSWMASTPCPMQKRKILSPRPVPAKGTMLPPPKPVTPDVRRKASRFDDFGFSTQDLFEAACEPVVLPDKRASPTVDPAVETRTSENSRFAEFGLSTQLLYDAACDEI